MKRSKPLRRKTPLKAKTPRWRKSRPEKREDTLNESWTRSKPIRDKKVYKWKVKTGKGIKRNKPMRRVSKKKLKVMREDYYPLNNEFLSQPWNRWCYVCLCRSLNCTVTELRPIMAKSAEEGDIQLKLSGAILSPATEAHHYRGRIGRLLDFEPFLLPSCRACREFPHTSFKEARRLELIAPAPIYNVFPQDECDIIAEEFEAWKELARKNNFEKTKKAA